MSATATLFLAASIRAATPLAFAALGELVVERAGLINVGLEGMMIAGAFGAIVGADMVGGVGVGLVIGALSGVGVAAVFALFVLRWKADMIITGTALSMLGLGATGALYPLLFGSAGVALRAPTLGPVDLPGLHALPVVGASVFSQPVVTYALYLIVPLLFVFMHRTTGGLVLRAVGERAEAVRAAGIAPQRVRCLAILFGGLMGGLGGATLVLAQAGTFVLNLTAGRGYIAIAIVVLGRWTVLGTAGAALLFGAASALQFLAQAAGWDVPHELSLAVPYILSLLAVSAIRGQTLAPAALGRPVDD